MPAFLAAPAVPYVVGGAKIVGGAILRRLAWRTAGTVATAAAGNTALNAMKKDDEANEQATEETGTIVEPCATGDCAETPSAEELEGKSAEEIDEMMKQKGWKGEPTNNGQGTKYPNPSRRGEQVRIMPQGTRNTSRPDLHGKPYGVVSKGGKPTRFNLR